MNRLARNQWRTSLNVRPLEERAVPAILINEIELNPPGTDGDNEFYEIINTAGGATPLTNIWLLEIEGDGGNAGTVDNAVNLSSYSTGTNGLLMVGNLYATNMTTPWGLAVEAATTLADLARPGAPTIENGNTTHMLVTDFTGAVAQDLDTDNDGVIDVVAWTSILDSVGWIDAGAPGKVYSAASLTQNLGTPDGCVRFPGNTNPSDFNAFYNGDLMSIGGTPDLGTMFDPTKCSANLPAGGRVTPGAANYGNPPAAPKLMTNPIINDGTSDQRSMVMSLQVTFDQPVTFPDGQSAAFVLQRTGPAGTTGIVNLSFVETTPNTFTITFVAGGAVGVESNGSLLDGLYTFTINSTKIQNAGGQQLDGNGNGIADGSPTDDVVLDFHRLFGDANGDRAVTAADFNAFRLAYGSGASIFDFDGDGQTSASDFNQFRTRYGVVYA